MKALLLDLDGTLVDSEPGILKCADATLAEFGVVGLSHEDLRGMIGPPLRIGFGRFLSDPAKVEDAVRAYRARYSDEGLLQAQVYAGVEDFLDHAQARGLPAYICTSKVIGFAERIATHFGLRGRLAGVFGAELDGRFDNKAELVAYILGLIGVDGRDAAIVGDRREDVAAGRAHGLRTVGALWGYGEPGELEGADLLCDRPHDLPAILDRLRD
jgi:phosphoglycolate phosphatase